MGRNISTRYPISTDSQHIVTTSNPQKTETLIFSSKMHFYMSPNSYDGEYLKREKCFIDLQEQKKCIRWSPAACNVARLRHKRDIQMSFTLKIYIQFYVWISAVNVTQNLCRDSSNSTYMFLDSFSHLSMLD